MIEKIIILSILIFTFYRIKSNKWILLKKKAIEKEGFYLVIDKGLRIGVVEKKKEEKIENEKMVIWYKKIELPKEIEESGTK